MSKVKNFFGGMVHFNVLGVNLALINKLRAYKVQNIKICGENLSFAVPILYAEQIKRLLRNFESSCIENSNLIRGVNFLLNRFILSVAILICCVLYFVFDFFIYSVRVTGGTSELQNEIMTYLNSNGIKKFSAKRTVFNCDIADLIMEKYPNVAHANIKVYGNTAVIMIAEAEYNLVKPKQNIYAKYDAVIKEIWVVSGIAKVGVGDIVKSGDLLVENAYADKVVIIGEVRFNTNGINYIFDINIV
jgi:hypothetical protein